MRPILCVSCLLGGLLFVLARPAGAGDEADLKALIAKAVKARGAEDEKLTAVTMKGKGVFYGMGEGIPYTGEWQIQQPDKIRVVISGGDGAFTMTRVFNGDKGWTKLNDGEAEELDKDAVAEEKHSLYLGRVTNLNVLLKDKGFKFAPAGEVKVGDRPAVGVRVSREGQRDITLFFDKQNHRLLKNETTVKDLMAGGQETTQATLYSGYKAIDGVQHAMKAEIQRDGKRYVDVQWDSFQPAERLDAAVFAKP
jgi:hypothetical protein